MKQHQQGFTLIELIVVIVILGILAATALPKFIDLSSEAQTAATAGVAGSISSGMSVNYGARKANVAKGTAVAKCGDAGSVLDGGLPSGYTVDTPNSAVAADTVANCTLLGPKSTSASFTAVGI